MPCKHAQNILVCSAWLPEQRCLRAVFEAGFPLGNRLNDLFPAELKLKEKLENAQQTGHIIMPRLEFLLLGIGAFHALEELVVYLERVKVRPDLVCFLGTAGQVVPSTDVFEHPFAVQVNKVQYFDVALHSGSSFVPDQIEATFSLESSTPEELRFSHLGQVPEWCTKGAKWVCATTLGITKEAPALYDQTAHFENLELYGLARACARFQMPWTSYLGISNKIGHAAHEEWKRFHIEASCISQHLFFLNHLTDSEDAAR